MIGVKFDNTLNIPKIVMPLYNESITNDPVAGSSGPGAQTKLDGIFAPLFRLNSYTIPFQQVLYMELTCDRIPKLRVGLSDSMGIAKTLDNPSNDNVLQLQILPKFDNTYKKINLLFYITNCEIRGTNINLEGVYNVPQFWDTNMTAFGKLSSYEFYEKIAKKYKLGFCSNINNTTDKRYIYSINTPILNLMESEIQYSGDNEHVYDFWIDYWNNIIFIDLYTEYKVVENDDNMKIWVPPINYNDSDDIDEQQPMEVTATIGNAPNMMQSPLYVNTYTPITTSSMITDKIVEIFNIDNRTTENIVIIDGDIKNDIFKSYHYFGENVGEYGYLYAKATREMFLNKINGQCIEVVLNQPALGLMRGGKVNFIFYDINKYTTQDEQMKSNITSNIPLPEDIITEDTKYIVNKSVSGQYYIISSDIIYSGYQWKQVLRLGRYADKVNKYSE